MKNSQLEIANIAKGVESSLVAVQEKGFENFIYVSIQDNKHITNNPKVALVADKVEFDKFVAKIKKELKGHSTPELRNVAILYCRSMCEILRVIKVDNDTFDVMMYYNYKRPKTKKYKDYVSLTAVDLENFIGGID